MLLTEFALGDYCRGVWGKENPHPPRPWRLKASEGKMPSGQTAGRRRYKAPQSLLNRARAQSLDPKVFSHPDAIH